MKKSVKRSGSPKGKLLPAPAPTDNKAPVENLEKAFKHGLCLRPRSGSRSPNKSVFKKASAPPAIIRPDSSTGTGASEGMTLRPRQKKIGGLSSEERKKSPLKPSEEYKMKVIQYREALGKLGNKEKFRYFPENMARRIPSDGFTGAEFSLCSKYLMKQDFELLDTIPEEYKDCKKYMDQVRHTKGYGVTMECSLPCYLGRRFDPYLQKWKKEPEVKAYVEKMIGMVLADMEIKMKRKGKTYQAGEGIENLVKSNWHHFLSFQVHRGIPSDPPEIVQALFTTVPRRPVVENLRLIEWKIKQGSKVVFYTELI